MLFKILITVCFLLVPSVAFAWGPLTHIYLGSEIYYLSPLLPAAVYGLLKRYRQDYLYGNLMADIILGKKYAKKNSHSWDVGLGLFESAKTQPEKAFSLGYMSHLAADTVAHGRYTKGRKNLEHAFLELRADSFVDRGYWFRAVAIDRKVQRRNDAFLEKSLEKVVFSFKTNRRIFKAVVAFSYLNKRRRLNDFIDRKFIRPENKVELKGLHEESLDRIVDVLQNGRRSEVLRKDPAGQIRRGRVLTALLR